MNDKMSEAEADAKDDGYMIGTVTDNKDPDGLGRIKVNIPGLFDPSQGEVPWIGPSKISPFGIGPTWGVYGSPAVGSTVRIELQDGDPHYALHVADEYVKANANPDFKDPATWGFKDPSGNQLLVNMTTQNWHFTHSSGLSIIIDQTGKLTITTPGEIDVSAQGNINFSAPKINLN
jgi:uncharacterized protein involved in type VI secretion and phage assembly